MPQKYKTEFPGVRYYEHATRKYGRGSSEKPDRYFSIRIRVDGKQIEEGCGWASEGWNAEKAFSELIKLKEARRIGKGPRSLSETREIQKTRAEDEKAAREKEERDKLTFSTFFLETYFPNAKVNKAEDSYKREDGLFRNWISPEIGNLPLKDITQISLERIKKNMKEAGQSPRSISYALAVIRQTFNFAKRNRIYSGDAPTAHVVFPKEDNSRLRFLTHAEVDLLLETLQKKNHQLYEMSLIAIHCGLRSGEIASLRWGDISLDSKKIIVRDTKNKVNRIVPMTEHVKLMLTEKKPGENNGLLFRDSKGEKLKDYNISFHFNRIINMLGFNNSVIDRRDRVVFHSLRHTYCSFLVEEGVDLYTVQKLAGHRTILITQKYSHFNDATLSNAVNKLEKALNNSYSLAFNKDS